MRGIKGAVVWRVATGRVVVSADSDWPGEDDRGEIPEVWYSRGLRLLGGVSLLIFFLDDINNDNAYVFRPASSPLHDPKDLHTDKFDPSCSGHAGLCAVRLWVRYYGSRCCDG